MRNKVQLYVGGKRADLDDGSFILFTYTAEDLANPTIVRNSFSRQITLKGTPTNDEIFGHIYRNDRITQYGGGVTGPDFDPTRKTPFAIYNETGEILEDGYLKLNKVVRKGAGKEYAVTLYGGLGSFLYGLAYDNAGNKRTLASLDYGEVLDFTINRTAVADAWARIGGDTSKAAKWEILNFMPCYAGFPDNEFNADKAVVAPAYVGLPTTDDTGRYTPDDGWSLVQLAEKVTGNEAGDYRSYLQKPVLRLQAVINAICDPANNGGWTVNLDPDITDPAGPMADYWDKAWLTLPMLNKLNIDFSGSSGAATVSDLSSITIPDGGIVATKYDIAIHLDPSCDAPSGLYKMDCEDDWAAGQPGDDTPGYYLNYLEVTVVVNRNGGASKTYVFRFSTNDAPAGKVQMDGVSYIFNGRFGNGGFDFVVSDFGVTSISVSMAVRGIAWGHLRGGADPDLVWPDYSYDFTDGVSVTWSLTTSDVTVNVRGVSSSTVRTGASITKAALLSGEHTPADYLLSFCKTFGLNLVCHNAEKTVDVIMRKNLYTSAVVDINGRIDRGKEIGKVPFAFDARWYAWRNEHKGEWAEYYANKYGQTFGTFRVNTGYEFDASEKAVTDGIIFQGLATVQETSKYFCKLTDNGHLVPSLFLGGGKFSLYRAGGESTDVNLPTFGTATKTWYNTDYPMHDDFPKIQLHGKDNANVDERDTLVFFDGMKTPASTRLSLTDDTIPMVTLNGNAPCWLPFYCAYDAGAKITAMPQFTRYIMTGGGGGGRGDYNNDFNRDFNRSTPPGAAIVASLDWGDPAELLVPGLNVGAGSNLFEQFWEKYIGDRYDDDSAVVTAWVDLSGLQVGDDLLRQFYAFDGAVWSLNRIIDYSLTTFGPTKCEFVKVQDITNYTTL